jgi:hypothetical protein
MAIELQVFLKRCCNIVSIIQYYTVLLYTFMYYERSEVDYPATQTQDPKRPCSAGAILLWPRWIGGAWILMFNGLSFRQLGSGEIQHPFFKPNI